MKTDSQRGRPQKYLVFLFSAGLALGLCGCAIGLYDPPAVVRNDDSQASLPPLKTSEVYFFLSTAAFPPGLQSVPLGTLYTPEDSQWSREKLIQKFQERAAEIGANAVVFTKVGTGKMAMGFLFYTGYATAYRLFKQNPSEDLDLSSSEYGTQNPDLRKVE
jgi:hypothetical protein